jgi:hypothetical protein
VVHDILHGGSHMLATITHNSDTLVVHHQILVVSLVSCLKRQGGRTGECLEMVAVKAGNCTPVGEES